VRGLVPDGLARSRILMLSHLDLIAGSSFRGQYEKRLRGVIDEAAADPSVVLFIDEIHNLVGAGTAIGQPLDAANLLKPALSRGALRVIGATTRAEYERWILPDAALERRFHPLDVAPLGREQTLEVLRARRPRLEAHHTLAITDEALAQAFASSEQPGPALQERQQPDKAIDRLDQACALERLRRPRALPDEIEALVAERSRLVAAEREAMDDLLGLANARGTPLERFSFGTYRALEAMGLGLERLVTGQVTPRPPLAQPDSVRRQEESDPAGRLTAAHRDRLLLEDRLRAALLSAGFVIDASHVAP
jgi:ATP-dependent Clp protease ATP-binding subunit ClpC